ncbi:MAG: Rrf2 family transcriptional regulator [Gemmatimonadota bacterium]|nr:MAG: Rrf2 family transcriptional regulator [Gemmatimonadota bacterium]
MRLTTKGRYGLRAMFEIAKEYGKGPIAIRTISERQHLSVHYLEQLLSKLRRSGLIQSVRGPGGGYVLAKKPSEISVGDIVRILEGPIALAKCIDESLMKEACEHVDDCVVRLMWKRISNKIEDVLNSITLADLSREMKTIDCLIDTC